jgi:hypothetical protein
MNYDVRITILDVGFRIWRWGVLIADFVVGQYKVATTPRYQYAQMKPSLNPSVKTVDYMPHFGAVPFHCDGVAFDVIIIKTINTLIINKMNVRTFSALFWYLPSHENDTINT